MKLKKLKKAVSLFTLLAMTMTTVNVSALTPNQNEQNETSAQEQKSDLERKIVGYFPEWAYKSKEHNYFNVTDLQWDSLTHIQYSFATVDPETNKIALGDKVAALEEEFEGMDLSYNGEKIELDASLPYKGHFNLLQQMKKQFPNVKLLMSVGGWAGSRGFYTMMDTDEGIDTFVQSCVDFVRQYGFDGIDIDFEFPSSTSQSGNPEDFDVSEPRRDTINERYNVMMKKLNKALDEAAAKDNTEYLLTAAVSASSWVLGGVQSNEYAKELDFLSIMSYDYHGGWNEFVENQANIYPDPADRETMNMIMPVLGMDWSYKYYRGVLPPEKILMGVPYYTRGWENVQGGNGTGLHGSSKTPATGKYNIWGDPDENGNIIPAGANPLWHVLNLMEQDPNLKVHWDDVGKVPYIWQNNEKVFLTFENEQSIDERLKYIEEKNLGGALIWVMDGDYGLNPDYVEGSTDINEGKYTYGDTLTTRLSNGLEKMGPAKETEEGNDNLPQIGVSVESSGTYDHPNYTYDFKVTNHTDETIEGGWELAFDLPKSAVYKSSWGGTATQEDNGDFTRVTLTSSGWQKLAPGETTNLQGMIGLCFSGVRNVTFNGMKPVGPGGGIPEVNQAPVLNGVVDKTINLGDIFDDMAGVTASDKEDGDLTSKIKVEGSVDTSKVGTYKLTYFVTDSEGLVTTKERTITVKEKVVEPEVNEAPVLSGVVDKTITVGDNFDKMAGVTASDREDGDLTSKIKVEGNVDTSKAGKYTLTYKVSDIKNVETVASRTITVKEKPTGDTYNPEQIYLEGDRVIYNGKEYVAKWWVKGENPDTSAAWELVIETNPDGSQEYMPGKAYVGGDVVVYNGKKYEAKWWTTSTPGSDDSWKAL
ncbi:MAG: glycosyl hydrolase family 18 protein [Peptostreptococcaceae bacterium]